MNNRFRFKIYVLLIVASISALFTGCENVETRVNYTLAPSERFYVCDNASVISEETESIIVNGGASLSEACGAQIVIVTVNGLGGKNIEKYTETVFNEWSIGDKAKNNGVLFLMSIGDDDYWAMNGAGLERSFSGGELGVILDDKVEPYFADKDYDAAALAFYNAALEKLEAVYGVTVSDTSSVNNSGVIQTQPQNQSEIYNEYPQTVGGGLTKIMGIAAIIVVVIIFSVIGSVFRGISRPSRGYYRPRPRINPFFFTHFNGPRGFDRRNGDFRGNGRGGPGGFGSSNKTGGFGGSSHGGGAGRSGGSGRSGGGSFHGGGGSTRGGGAGRGRR